MEVFQVDTLPHYYYELLLIVCQVFEWQNFEMLLASQAVLQLCKLCVITSTSYYSKMFLRIQCNVYIPF